jgi:glycosyltransferase involved in cell wall biosynthesis
MMKASIVIPAYNASKTIAKTLEACLAQSVPSEVIVVDDGSADRTKELVSSYPVKYIYQPNAGPAAARNKGWAAAEGDIIIFTDSDCVPEKEWVKKLLMKFDSGDVGAAGGTYGIMNPENITALSIHNEIQYRHSMLPEYVRYIGSFSLAIRKSVLVEVGGFDESFKIACGEDADLTYRINDKGYDLRFSRDISVGHFFPDNPFKFLRQQFWRGFWIMKLYAKHKRKLGNDDYSKLRDTIQPMLYALIAMLATCVFEPFILTVFIFLNIFAVLIHTPVVLFAIKREKSPKMLFLYPLLYFRGFFWAAGCAAGAFKFLI